MKVSIRSLALLAVLACGGTGQAFGFTRAQLLECVRRQVPGVGGVEWLGVTEVVKALWWQEGVEDVPVDYAVLGELYGRIRGLPGCEGLDYNLLVEHVAAAEFGPVREADPDDELPDPDDQDFDGEAEEL